MATFSVTELGTFRRCRRMWDFSGKSRKNLTAIGSGPEPLELGGLIHRALADFLILPEEDQKKTGMLKLLFLRNAYNRKTEVEEAYKEKTKRDVIPPDALQSLINVIELGTDMMGNYQEYWKTAVPDNMKFAVPEQEVLIPVPGTQHQCPECLETFDAAIKNNVLESAETLIYEYGTFKARNDCKTCNGTGTLYHYLSATLDGLLQGSKDRLYVLEHKTYENRPNMMSLYMNDQFTGYAWVVRQLGIGKVVGIAYDGMWKRREPPKYMQKEKRKGTIDDLFIRKIIPKLEDELDEWGENLTKTINDMGNNPAIYPNVPWQGCSDCSFQEVCYMMMRREDSQASIDLRYTQRQEIVRGGKST